jgi:uncharacterized protein YjhX (UPF0386 family)
MTRLSATQRRVLADLAAGGYITTFTMSARATLYRADGTTDPRSVMAILMAFTDRGWVTAHSIGVGQHEYRITAAGQRARAVLQEATP